MVVYLGNTKESELYFGNTSIGEAYYGNTRVYTKEPWYTSDLSGNKVSQIYQGSIFETKNYYENCINAKETTFSIVDGQFYHLHGQNLRQSGRDFVYVNSSAAYIIASKTKIYSTNGTGTTLNQLLSGNYTTNSLYFYSGKGFVGNNGVLNYVKLSGTGYNPTINSSTFVRNYNSIFFPEENYNITNCIIDGDLYKLDASVDPFTLTLIDSGGWTDVNNQIGIKNGSLYRIMTSNGTIVLLDNSETYSKKTCHCGTYSYAVSDKGNIAVISGSTLRKNPSSFPKGRWDSVSINNSSGITSPILAIRNGALYAINGSTSCTLIDDARFYTQVAGINNYGICVSSGNRILRT